MRGMPDAELEELVAAIAVARMVLGPAARIQAPPNLVDGEYARLHRPPGSTTGAGSRR